MGFANYKHDPEYILNNIAELDSSFVTLQDCSFMVPYSYLQYKLARMGELTTVAAVLAIVMGDKYAVLNACANLVIEPDETNQIKVNGVEYLEFKFTKGQALLKTKTIVKDSDLLYDMHVNFYQYGRIPEFLSYDDVGKLFLYHNEYGGLNISPDNIPFELMTSKICRDRKDRFTYYRHTDQKFRPVTVPFSSVLFNSTSTTAKILGGYLEDGFTSAILNPSDQPHQVETLLRA